MQADSTSTDDVLASKTMKRTMGLLALVAVTAAAGIATIDADLSPQILKTDASANGAQALALRADKDAVTASAKAPAAAARADSVASLQTRSNAANIAVEAAGARALRAAPALTAGN